MLEIPQSTYCIVILFHFLGGLQWVTDLSARLSFITDSAVWFMQFFSIIFIKFMTANSFCKLQYYFVGHWICIFLVLLDVAHLAMKEKLSAYLIHFSVSHNHLCKTFMCMGGKTLHWNPGAFMNPLWFLNLINILMLKDDQEPFGCLQGSSGLLVGPKPPYLGIVLWDKE